MESDRAENQPVPAEEDTRDGGVLRSSSSKLLATIRNLCMFYVRLGRSQHKLRNGFVGFRVVILIWSGPS
jgi:hypothetical protein